MKKRLPRYMLFLLVIIVAAYFFTAVFLNTGKQYKEYSLPEASDVFLYDGEYELTQYIDAEDSFVGIALSLSATEQSDRCLTVTVSSSEGKVIAEKQFTASSDYSAPKKVTALGILGSPAGVYTVTVKSEGNGAPAPYYYIGNSDTAQVNGNTTDCSIVLSPIYSNTVGIEMFFTVLFGLAFIIFALYVLIHSLDLGNVTAFAVCISVFLLLGALIMPLGAGVEEREAFPIAYTLSNGKLSPTADSVVIPEGFSTVFTSPSGYLSVTESLNSTTAGTGSYTADISSGNTFFPIAYLPAAAGIRLCNLFTDNVATIFYCARAATAIFSIFILILTMNILPWGKRVFFVICLNPAVITLLCTVSSFGIPLTLSFLLFAMVMNIRDGKTAVSAGKIVALAIVSTLTAMSSFFLVPFVLLTILAVPKKYHKSTASSVLTAVFCSALPAVLGVLRSVLSTLAEATLRSNLKQLLTDPNAVIGFFAGEIKEYSSAIVLSIFGERIAEKGDVISGGLSSVVIMILTLTCAVLDRNLKGKFSRKDKCLMAVLGIASALSVLLSACVRSGAGNYSMSGLLGCLFIPAVMVYLFIFGDNNIKFENDENSQRLRASVYSIGMFPYVFSMLSTVIYYI